MIKFIAGLLVGLSIASAGADFQIMQANGEVAIIKSNVDGSNVHTIVVVCAP